MALVHRATLHPGKLALLAVWLPTRLWYRGPTAPDLRQVCSYRFDDPAGAVGIETILVRAGDGPLHQVPLTYRGAPLAGHEQWLVGTTDHSVLGKRWVYDGCRDSVYARTLASTIFKGASQAEEFVDMDGRPERRKLSMRVRGSGSEEATVPAINALESVDDDDPTVILADSVALTVPRVLDGASGPATGEQHTLSGTWDGQATPLSLAYARMR